MLLFGFWGQPQNSSLDDESEGKFLWNSWNRRLPSVLGQTHMAMAFGGYPCLFHCHQSLEAQDLLLGTSQQPQARNQHHYMSFYLKMMEFNLGATRPKHAQICTNVRNSRLEFRWFTFLVKSKLQAHFRSMKSPLFPCWANIIAALSCHRLWGEHLHNLLNFLSA